MSQLWAHNIPLFPILHVTGAYSAMYVCTTLQFVGLLAYETSIYGGIYLQLDHIIDVI